MANHCIYLTCLTCKIQWCIRCGDTGVVAAEAIEKLKANRAPTLKGVVRCPKCKSDDHLYRS